MDQFIHVKQNHNNSVRAEMLRL